VSAPNHTSRALAAVVGIGLLVAGCGSGGTLSAKALSQESSTVQSLAAEGALLARNSAAGRTTHVFTRVHSEYLHKAASQSAKSLQSAKTTPVLQPKLERTARVATRVTSELEQLGHASSAEQQRLARELERNAKALA
jgi:outer membrane murein-binding lipoprotein Lpp